MVRRCSKRNKIKYKCFYPCTIYLVHFRKPNLQKPESLHISYPFAFFTIQEQWHIWKVFSPTKSFEIICSEPAVSGRIPFIFDDFHFCRSRVIVLDMTENRILTLCRMITWVLSVPQNVLKFYQAVLYIDLICLF